MNMYGMNLGHASEHPEIEPQSVAPQRVLVWASCLALSLLCSQLPCVGLGELSLDNFGPLAPFFFSMMRGQDEIMVLKLGSGRPMGSTKKPGEPLL